MPKIIDNLRETIIEKSKKLIQEKGYDQTTVRSIVKECGISVGTMYNYFPSKEALVTSFLLDDWEETKKRISKTDEETEDIWVLFEQIYNEILAFSERYSYIFKSNSAQYEVSGQFEKRHSMLRYQLAEIIENKCKKHAVSYTDFLSYFICEMLLSFSNEKVEFSKLKAVMMPLFK